MRSAKNKWFTLWIVVLLFPVACSVQDHYRALTFFFDGVPNPEDSKLSDSSKILNNPADSAKLNAIAGNQDFDIHKPYLEKECDMCHNPGRMGSFKLSMPELCTQCHTDLALKVNYEHGPVASGYCTECHNPHKSKEKKLLVRAGKELCLYCHDSETLYNNSFHDSSDKTNCTSCHNPHGSNNHSLLKPGVCYTCHDDFSKKYAIVHGPVESGNCSACHVPHYTKTENLLARTNRDLCYYCHNKKQVLANIKHKGTEKVNCTNCHDPHGGNDRFMLKL
jgi:predicted CXXCH cytochrome family protein